MANEENAAGASPITSVGGYFRSFIVFSGITALWVFLVRDDDFYASTAAFGYNLPATTLFYLLTMPAFGYFAGQWRFYQEARGPGSLITGSLAQFFQFLYSHILIVLFTAAMVTRTLLGVNIDSWVQEIDDQFFTLASRFAPWLAAYLAGFNLGRALGLRRWASRSPGQSAAALDQSSRQSDVPALTGAPVPVATAPTRPDALRWEDATDKPEDAFSVPHREHDGHGEPRDGSGYGRPAQERQTDWRFPDSGPASSGQASSGQASSGQASSGQASQNEPASDTPSDSHAPADNGGPVSFNRLR